MAVGAAIGVVEGASAQVLNVQWQQVVVFAILLVYLVVKAARVWRPSLFQIRGTWRSPAGVAGGG
jgi:branched-subunit amino acid ABC-type transport system permease component